MSEIVIEGTDGRGNPLRIHRHDEYATPQYSVSYTDEDGQRVFTTLMDRADADWRYHELLMAKPVKPRRSITEVAFPPGYDLSIMADGVTVYAPSGEVFGHYGEAYCPDAIAEAAWEEFLDAEGVAEEMEARAEDPHPNAEMNASIVAELCERLELPEDERDIYRQRTIMATLRDRMDCERGVLRQVEATRRQMETADGRPDWIGGTE